MYYSKKDFFSFFIYHNNVLPSYSSPLEFNLCRGSRGTFTKMHKSTQTRYFENRNSEPPALEAYVCSNGAVVKLIQLELFS